MLRISLYNVSAQKRRLARILLIYYFSIYEVRFNAQIVNYQIVN